MRLKKIMCYFKLNLTNDSSTFLKLIKLGTKYKILYCSKNNLTKTITSRIVINRVGYFY